VIVKIRVFHSLVALSILLVISNLAMLAYFSIENARLKKAIEAERSLYEEAVQLHVEELSRYEVLYGELQEALKENEELKEFFVNMSSKVVVPQDYVIILEREEP